MNEGSFGRENFEKYHRDYFRETYVNIMGAKALVICIAKILSTKLLSV